jgi:hypothetical protein
MKTLLSLSALGLLVAGTSCSQDKVLHNPRNNYQGTSMKSERRKNDKSEFKKNRSPVGFGLDLNANNPYKFRMVNSPKKYKYSKPK